MRKALAAAIYWSAAASHFSAFPPKREKPPLACLEGLVIVPKLLLVEHTAPPSRPFVGGPEMLLVSQRYGDL